MNYCISDKNIKDPLIEQILKELNPVFEKLGARFYLIGATARDIILSLYKIEAARATRDLDIAVAVSDWDKYNEIEVEILKLSGFKKDKKQRQRFIYKKVFPIDIVPFGNIKRRDDKIYWPPDESVAMSVLAFEEVEKNTLILVLANDLNIKVATLAGTFILKMIAWQDRHTRTNKDANDMAFIIQNYLSINQERAAKTYYSHIYLDEDFNINIGGTMLLAFDIKEIMKNNKNALTKFRNIIEGELMAEESSVLINQIIETNPVFEYEGTHLCFKKMLLVLENKPTQ